MSQQPSPKNISTRGTGVPTPDNTGQTELHIAAAAGDLELVERLMDAKASVISADKIQQTPLHKAAQNNHAKVVEQLLVRGGYKGSGSSRYLYATKDSKGQTPYDLAVASGHYEVVLSILSCQAIKTSEELHRGLSKAVEIGHADITELLLRNKAEVDSAHPRLLYQALEPGKEQVLAVLLESKSYGNISINGVLKEGLTPLEYAAQLGNKENVLALLAAKAKIFQKNLLHLAAKSGNSDVLAILLKACKNGEGYLNINELDNKGLTPLEYAARLGNKNSVLALLAAKAQIFQKNLLQPATKAGNSEVLTILLEAKADPSQIPQLNVSTPLHFFVNLKFSDPKFRDDMIQKLIAAKAPLDAPDEKGHTPLHLAAMIGNPLAVQILLDAKANPLQKSKGNLLKLDSGKTAFDLVRGQLDTNTSSQERQAVLDLLRPPMPTQPVARPLSSTAVTMEQLQSPSASLTSIDSKHSIRALKKPKSPAAVAATRGFIGSRNKSQPFNTTYSSMTELIPLRDRVRPSPALQVLDEEEIVLNEEEREIFASGSDEPYHRPDTPST